MKGTSSLFKLILPIFGVGVFFILFLYFGLELVYPDLGNSQNFLQLRKMLTFILFLMLILLGGTTYIIFVTYIKEPLDKILQFLSLVKEGKYETFNERYNAKDIDEFIESINTIISFLDQKEKATTELIEEIKHNEAFTKDIIDSQVNPIIVMKDEKIVSANKAFYKYFNDCMHLQGDNLNNYSIFINKFKKEEGFIYNFKDQHWIEYLLANKDTYHQVKFIDDDEREYIFQIDVTAIDDDQYIVSLNDVTEYITAMKKAQAAQSAKSTFLATMSHEIRTPLNGILGFAKLLETVDIPKKEKGYINIINSSANSLLGIINDILDISKMESGKLELETHQFDPFKEFEPTVELFVAKADEKNIDLLFFLDPQLPRALFGDSLKLKQVLSNLLSNAIKFTPEHGEIYIRIELLEENEGTSKIRFSVKDSGVGIPEEVQATIFEPFAQADSSVTRKFGGTGLGLAICSKIIKAMNSQINLSSEPHKGSEFFFTLEMKSKNERTVYQHIDDNLKVAMYCEKLQCKSQLGIIKKYIEHYVDLDIINDLYDVNIFDILILEYKDFQKLDVDKLTLSTLIIINNEFKNVELKDNFKVIKAPINPSKLYDAIVEISNPYATQEIVYDDVLATFDGTVLVAEDNFVNQQLMIAMLKQRGIKTIIANNGQEAVEMVKKHNDIEMVFMDINMPVMNGLDATDKIKEYENNQELDHLPIVALTANAVAGDKERFLEHGMDDYIPKPFEEKQLDAVLEKYVKKQNSETVKKAELPKIVKSEPKAGQYDIEQSAKSLGLQLSIFSMIFKTFLDHIDSDIEVLEKAINEEDFEAIKNMAHKIKGASANLKIEKVRELTYNMEQKAKDGINDQFETKLNWLKTEIEKLKEVYEDFSS